MDDNILQIVGAVRKELKSTEIIYALGEPNRERKDIQVIPTGSIALNEALGIGGIPRGRIIEVLGVESGGKTTLLLHIIREAQKLGIVCAIIDAEHALDPKWAELLGVDVENLLISQPDTGEQALELAETLVHNGVGLIGIDSVAALTPRAEIEGDFGDAQMGLQARLMSQAMRKLNGAVSKSGSTLIFINQIRMMIGVMFGCFHYDTLVNFADGTSLPIGQVVENRINKPIFSYDQENDRIIVSEIIDWHVNGKVTKKQDFTHIQTESIDGAGRFGFTCTNDHNILTDSGWKKAKDIVLSDKLISKYESIFNLSLKSFLSGTLVGDSHISIRSKNTANIRLQDSNSPDYVRWKVDKLSPFFEFSAVATGAGRVRYDSNFTYELTKIKNELGNRDPKFFFNSYSDLGLALWFMDDAHLDIRTSHKRYTLSIKRFSGNRTKLKEIQKEFELLGIKSTLSIKDGAFRFNKKATELIARRICRFVPECMQYKLPEEYRNNYSEFFLTSETIIRKEFVNICLIRSASDRQMRKKLKYDLSIANSSTYMVGGVHNGVVVHNSPETTTGGRALKFYASVRLDIRRKGWILEGETKVGAETKVKVVKNKVAPPFREAIIELYFDRGFDDSPAILEAANDLGILNKSGSWYSYKDVKVQGCKKFLDTIGQTVFNEIKALVETGEEVTDVAESEQQNPFAING